MIKAVSGLAAGMLLFASLGANAVLISVAPSAQTVTAGESLFVDIVISDLGAGLPPTLGGFDIDVMFDGSLLDLDSVVFGTGLDVLGLGSVQGVAVGPGMTNVFEVSLDSVLDLTLLQPDSFTLFTLNFSALAGGVSVVDLDVNSISTATGQSFPNFNNVENGEVTVVPVPATLLLFGLGLVGVGVARKRRLSDL